MNKIKLLCLFLPFQILDTKYMSTQKRLFLLDAYALIFRGYYAFYQKS